MITPDRIPAFPENRVYRYDIPLEQIKRMKDLMKEKGMSMTELFQKILKIGLILEHAGKKGGEVMIRQKRVIRLFEPDNYDKKSRGGLLFFTSALKLVVPSILAAELQEVANKYHVTVEDVCREFIDKGLDIAEANNDPNSTVVLIENGTEHQFKIF